MNCQSITRTPLYDSGRGLVFSRRLYDFEYRDILHRRLTYVTLFPLSDEREERRLPVSRLTMTDGRQTHQNSALDNLPLFERCASAVGLTTPSVQFNASALLRVQFASATHARIRRCCDPAAINNGPTIR
jgi:hypothetical protein